MWFHILTSSIDVVFILSIRHNYTIKGDANIVNMIQKYYSTAILLEMDCCIHHISYRALLPIEWSSSKTWIIQYRSQKFVKSDKASDDYWLNDN